MECDYAFLADAAQVLNGKLYVMGGGVTVLWRNQFPAPMGIAIAASFTYNRTEAGRKRKFELHINDADGQAIVPPLITEMQLPKAQAGAVRGVPLAASFAITIAAAPILKGPGMYAVELLVDDNHIKSLPFAVAIPTANPNPT